MQALRLAKNFTKGYSDTQAKVRIATSNDPWPPALSQMEEIALLTYNQQDLVEVIEILDSRLNDRKGRNWRHVFKCLTVIDYILHSGSENVIRYFRDNFYIISTLKEFQYIDADGYDRGVNIRSRAKELTALLLDDVRLRAARRVRAGIVDRPWPESRHDDAYLTDGAPRRARRRWSFDGDSDGGGRQRRRNFSIENDAGKKNKRERLFEKSLAERKRALALEKLKHEEAELATAKQLREEVEAKRAKAQEEEAKRKVEEKEEKRRRALQDEATRRKALGDANAMALLDDRQQMHPPNPLLMCLPDPMGLQSQQLGIYQQQQALQTQLVSKQQELQQLRLQHEQLIHQQHLQQQQLHLTQHELMAQQQQQQAQQFQTKQQELVAEQRRLQAQKKILEMQAMANYGSKNPFVRSVPIPSTSTKPVPIFRKQADFNLLGTFENSLPSDRVLDSLLATSYREKTPTLPASWPIRSAKSSGVDQELLSDLWANRETAHDTFGNFGSLRYGSTSAGRSLTQNDFSSRSLVDF